MAIQYRSRALTGLLGDLLADAFTAVGQHSTGALMTPHQSILELRERMSRSIIGQTAVVERLVIGLLSNGNLLLEGTPGHAPPDHARCIKISTDASLREMVPPAILVMTAPVVTGAFFGVEAVVGLLAGGLVSGVQLAISASNTGGAWDNAKKYVEKGGLVIDVPKRDEVTGEIVRNMDGTPVLVPVRQRKGGECHKAAVVGDTVGDPLKDTSGPALNILMKLMAIISLVFADFFMSINNGQGYFNVPRQTF